jgi:hypothetical protein
VGVKMKRKQYFTTAVALLVVLLFSGCQWLTSDIAQVCNRPLPPWINEIDSRLDVDEMVYVVTVDQSVVWQPGRDSGDITKQIANSINVTVNGNPVDGVYLFATSSSLIPIYMYNASNVIIGSHEGLADIYFVLPAPSGFHVATLQFTLDSGAEYAYSWCFVTP